MDRVLDVSFDTIQSRVDLLKPATQSKDDNEQHDHNDNHVDNRGMIKDIAEGNISFRFHYYMTSYLEIF